MAEEQRHETGALLTLTFEMTFDDVDCKETLLHTPGQFFARDMQVNYRVNGKVPLKKDECYTYDPEGQINGFTEAWKACTPSEQYGTCLGASVQSAMLQATLRYFIAIKLQESGIGAKEAFLMAERMGLDDVAGLALLMGSGWMGGANKSPEDAETPSPVSETPSNPRPSVTYGRLVDEDGKPL